MSLTLRRMNGHPKKWWNCEFQPTKWMKEEDEDEELNAQRQEQIAQKEDKSRAVVLEMLGDLPSAGTCSMLQYCSLSMM